MMSKGVQHDNGQCGVVQEHNARYSRVVGDPGWGYNV